MLLAVTGILKTIPFLTSCISYIKKALDLKQIVCQILIILLPGREQAASALPAKPCSGCFQDCACTAYTNRWYSGFCTNRFRDACRALFSIRYIQPANPVFSFVGPPYKKLSLFLPFPAELVFFPAFQMQL